MQIDVVNQEIDNDKFEKNEYKIKTNVFEGPMELLIHLLEKNKVDIYDIPISEITAQYLAYLDSMQELDMDVASEFLVMATLLLHIKVRMLLPQVNSAKDEQEISDDPRDILVEKIIEYKRLQKYTKILEKVYMEAGKYTFRPVNYSDFKQNTVSNYSSNTLFEALNNLIVQIKKNQIVHYVNMDELSVQAYMKDILNKLGNITDKNISFAELLEHNTKEEIIVTFLAILELLKQGNIEVSQSKMFAPLYIETRG